MLTRLLNDHDHIQKALNLLEIQFLDLCRDRNPDFAMMLSIVVYIQEFPEQAHHPFEDTIYALLLERLDEVKIIRELLTDHTELETLSRKLRASLESFKNKSDSTKALKQQLSEFLYRQRWHLHTEEMKVYPLINHVITDQEWANAQAGVTLMDDPVFGERTHNDYALLHRAIDRHFK